MKKILSLFKMVLVIALTLGIASSSLAASSSTASSSPSTKIVISGVVTAVSKKTLSVTSLKAATTTKYVVDTTQAEILRAGKKISTSDVKVNSSVVVQGNLDGDKIIATKIINQEKIASTTMNKLENGEGKKLGIFKRIGLFFSNLFKK